MSSFWHGLSFLVLLNMHFAVDWGLKDNQNIRSALEADIVSPRNSLRSSK